MTPTHVDHCAYGFEVQKETLFLSGEPTVCSLARRCSCRRHKMFGIFEQQGSGVGKDKVFASARLARFPERLADALAASFVDSMQRPPLSEPPGNPSGSKRLSPRTSIKQCQLVVWGSGCCEWQKGVLSFSCRCL